VSIYFSATSGNDVASTISILGTTGENNTPDDTNVLWTKDYPDGFAQNWYDIDLSASPPALTKDTVYAIVLHTTGDTSSKKVRWNIDELQNLYANGKMWEDRGSGWQTLTISDVEKPNADAAFKTYVTVPEPTTMAFLCLGGMFFFARKIVRRRSF